MFAPNPLWPIRYKPLPDELLSCWLVRLAHGHGLKVQTFCNIVFGNQRQIWNRDIDRLAPAWLMKELALRTGTPITTVSNTTLRSYERKLYRNFRSAGVLNWILILQMYHRKREGFGLQFCPTCLASDKIPYFRKIWRVALCTICPIHKTMLLDRCPNCTLALAVHRVDMRTKEFQEENIICICHNCAFDLRYALGITPPYYFPTVSKILEHLVFSLDSSQITKQKKHRLAEFSLMRQICRLMTASYEHVTIRSFVLKELGQSDIILTEGRISFEMRPIEQRHHLLQLASWIVEDMENRLTAAWRCGAIRYNLLLKDFLDPPDSYVSLVKNFSNWHDRIKH